MQMISLLLLLLTATLAQADVSAGESYRRVVSFEWEAIEGAKSYDIELTYKSTNKNNNKPQVFKVNTAEWQGPLKPGTHLMRLRARDYRGVPGDWSELSEVIVYLENVHLTSPENGEKIISKNEDEDSIKITWKPTPGASKYEYLLIDAEGKEISKNTTSETSAAFAVPVAQVYNFKIRALDSEGYSSEADSILDFSVVGGKIQKPEIKKPDNVYVRQLEWTASDKSQYSDVTVLKFNAETKKWEKFQSYQALKDNNLPFESTWPGGRYQVAVKSRSPLRQDSDFAKVTFEVKDGNRSPAAEYTAMIRKSIERLSGWYGVASYLITQMQFEGENPEFNSVSSYSAVGGTGRLGLGWAKPENPWGFLTILDLSGFTFEGKTQTFASLESNVVFRKSFGDRGEVRGNIGLFYKELPETIGDPLSNSSSTTNIAFAGPHFGGEYWYSLTPKLGLQVNSHLYYSLFKVKTPNGLDIEPTLSTQFGIMGSYRLSENFTGLMGYAMRVDRVSYQSQTGGSSLAADGDVNSSTITGHYLNFLAEYNF
ncbi:MAG: hypothetical protein ACLGGX_02535 [Bdellovibrionia bacterium]